MCRSCGEIICALKDLPGRPVSSDKLSWWSPGPCRILVIKHLRSFGKEVEIKGLQWKREMVFCCFLNHLGAAGSGYRI